MNRIRYEGPGGLWIGDIEDARTEPLQDFGTVITVCQDDVEDHIPEGVEYCFFNMADGRDTTDKYGGNYSYKYFERAADMLYNELASEESVFIHCHAGQSRSVAVSIAALGRLLGEPRYKMYDLVEYYRPQMRPNMDLMDHASRYIRKYNE